MPTTEPSPARAATPHAPWGAETFGHVLVAMAHLLGLRTEDVALCVAGILCNLTGPTSGFDTRAGKNIPAGISLLSIGNVDHRVQRLADHLLHPVFTLQDWFREVAARSNRALTDAYTFGATSMKDWMVMLKGPRTEFHDTSLAQFSAIHKDLEGGDGLTNGWDLPEAGDLAFAGQQSAEPVMRQRVPGLRHLPSFILTGSDAAHLPAMMKDVADRHAFVADPEGRLFRGAPASSTAKGAAAMRQFAMQMAGGDAAVVPLQPVQGYGTLQRSRIRIMSAMSLQQAGEILGSSGAPEGPIMENCLLWNPSWQPIGLLEDGHSQGVWERYKGVLERLVNDRAGKQGTILPLSSEDARKLEDLDMEVMTALDAHTPSIRPYLRPFSSLVYRLFWAFSLFKGNREPDWCLHAARATVMAALHGHVAILESALSQVRTQKLVQDGRRILKVVADKGPCTARGLQRSIFNSRAAGIEAALEHLLGAQQIVYCRSSGTYDLPGEGAVPHPGRSTDRSQPLTCAAHG